MSVAVQVLGRLRTLQETRGWFGLARFLATRVLRTQSDVVFERAMAGEDRSPAMPDFGAGRRLVIVDRRNLDEPALSPVVTRLLTGDSAVYRTGLERGDMALAIVNGEGVLLHRSFIQFETRYKTLLGEAIAVPLIANCHTEPSARGERLYPKALLYAASLLARQGHAHAIITCDAANIPSIRGILRAGFREKRRITSLVVLLRLAIQHIRWSDGRASWRVTWI